MPDWAETEPDPVRVPTIAWVSRHIGFWWSVAADHLRGRPPRERTDITWPGGGEATVAWLRGLRVDWLAALGRLDNTDLDATAPFPLAERPPVHRHPHDRLGERRADEECRGDRTAEAAADTAIGTLILTTDAG